MTKRRERILRAILPLGLGLLVLWVGWLVLAVVMQADSGISGVSAALGGINSIGLVVTGYMYRRELDRLSSRR